MRVRRVKANTTASKCTWCELGGDSAEKLLLLEKLWDHQKSKDETSHHSWFTTRHLSPHPTFFSSRFQSFIQTSKLWKIPWNFFDESVWVLNVKLRRWKPQNIYLKLLIDFNSLSELKTSSICTLVLVGFRSMGKNETSKSWNVWKEIRWFTRVGNSNTRSVQHKTILTVLGESSYPSKLCIPLTVGDT